MPDLFSDLEQPQSLTLAQLTDRITRVIHGNPTIQNVWVVAELSDVAVRGGHFYADLIQKDESGRTLARMRANLWASRFGYLRARYLADRGDDLRNGIKVRIQGNATHHSQYGLSFNITDIDSTYVDEGDLLRRRMEILNMMKREGLDEENKGIPLNMDAQRVAIVSAEGAAGLGDFINQLESNPGNFRFEYKVFNSPMQGERAAAGVIDALGRIMAEAERWDCVVIIRGGGATADMNCFDDERLARNVCMFPLPVIVGIGHERDNCVLDYLAHTRCKTPTAVAEFLINHQREAWQRACEAVTRITAEAKLRLEGEHRHLAQIEAFVPATARQILEREGLRISNLTTAIPVTVSSVTSKEKARLDGLKAQLIPAAGVAVSRAKERLRSVWSLIEVLKPENTLKRGYSITRLGGKAVRSVAQLPPDTVIETTLPDGTVVSRTL